MPHYPFSKMIPSRWPFYTFTILCTLFQTFAALNAPASDAKYLTSFATVCAVLSIFTALWICILLCYGRSEADCQHPLARCDTHIISFGVITVLWFGIGIFFAIHARIECRRHTPVCVPLQFSTLLAFLTVLSSCLCVACVICPIAVAGGGYNTHVEDARGRAQNSPLPDTPMMSLSNLTSPPPAHIYR